MPAVPKPERNYGRPGEPLRRRFSGQPFRWTLRFDPDQAPAESLMQITAADGAEGETQELHPMIAAEPGLFTLNKVLERPGLYLYRALFRYPDGSARWDPLPYGEILIDPPAAADLRLYTLIPPVSGTIKEWWDKAEEIRSLGFNALHLLPITVMGSSGSPYAVADHFAVDPAYSPVKNREDRLQELDGFVDHCARIGLRLCFDLVLNHTAADGDLASAHPEWIRPNPDETDGFQRAGCWHKEEWIEWRDLLRIWFDHPIASVQEAIWDYFESYALFWAERAARTGGLLRFDNIHSSHAPFIASLNRRLNRSYPSVAFLAEYFEDPAVMVRQVPRWRLNLLLANPWEYPFTPELRRYIGSLHAPESPLFLLPVSSHDTEAPAELFGRGTSAVPRYLIGALLGTGQTGLVQGSEDGIRHKIGFIGRPNSSELGLPEHTPGRFHDIIRRINMVMAQEPLCRRQGNLRFIDGNHPAVIAAVRETEEGTPHLLVAANLDTAGAQRLPLGSLPAETGLHGAAGRELLFFPQAEPEASAAREAPQPLPETLTLPPCGVSVWRLSNPGLAESEG